MSHQDFEFKEGDLVDVRTQKIVALLKPQHSQQRNHPPFNPSGGARLKFTLESNNKDHQTPSVERIAASLTRKEFFE